MKNTFSMLKWTLLIVALACMQVGCGGTWDDGLLEGAWQVSGCTGDGDKALKAPADNPAPLTGADPICAPEDLLPQDHDPCTESLYWHYEPGAGRIQLVNAPVSLNCCGRRSMRAVMDEGVLEVTERDAPDDGRCKCMCDVNYSACLSDLPQEPLELRLMRVVTDESLTPKLVWEGSLDLSQGYGRIDLGPSQSFECF